MIHEYWIFGEDADHHVRRRNVRMETAIDQKLLKGLDVGTSRIVLARKAEEHYQYEAQLNAFVSLPYSRMTANMLQREGIMNRVEGPEILAYGNRVEEFANLLDGDTRRPMQYGLLNADEPKSLQMMETALSGICGPASDGERICFSVPAAPQERSSDLTFHERTVKQILEKLGYQAQSLNEGLAIVYAEMEASNYTGIGMSFGGGMCNVAVAYLGLPVLTFATTRSGDYIDQSAASVSGQTSTTVRLHKEDKFALNGLSSNSLDQALGVYYQDVVNAAVDELERQLAETKKLPKMDKPVPLAVSGGTATPKGFADALEKTLRDRTLPMEISEVRLVDDALNTTAKGCLISAMLEM